LMCSALETTFCESKLEVVTAKSNVTLYGGAVKPRHGYRNMKII
jgi:hypothetical protein